MIGYNLDNFCVTRWLIFLSPVTFGRTNLLYICNGVAKIIMIAYFM